MEGSLLSLAAGTCSPYFLHFPLLCKKEMALPAVCAFLSHYYHTHDISDPEVWTSPHTKQFSATPAQCPTVCPFLTLTGVSEGLTSEGLSLTRLLPAPPTLDANYK